MDFEGRRILVVEDDRQLAKEVCDTLARHGATVIGPAPTPFYAMSLLGRRTIDAAVLDIRLHGTTVYELADELLRRGTPIVFVTETSPTEIPARFRAVKHLGKPYNCADLLDVLAELMLPPSMLTPQTSKASLQDGEDHQNRLMRAVAAAMRSRIQTVLRKRHESGDQGPP